MTRILFECLDWPHPAGGIRRIYRHVEILTSYGYDARILHHSPGFRATWFRSSARVDYWTESYRIGTGDVLVIPEGHVDIMRSTKDAVYRRVVLALNWARIYKKLPIGTDWRNFGIEHVISGGHYEQHFIRRTMGLESTVILSGIDTEMFKPASAKACQVVFMPAKNSEYAHLIVSAFRARYPMLLDVPFLSLMGVAHDKVADALAKSAVFLAHTFPEGFSRKTLEAMASGCIVVGHSGQGSAEYMNHLENCYLAQDGDALLVTEYLSEAIECFRSGAANSIQDSARNTAQNYSLEREEVSVQNFWRDFLNKRD